MHMQILSGRAALEQANSSDFRMKWLALFAHCPWATACQHPDFVAPWFELYGSAYLPIMVVDQLDDGSLNGLLPLALRPDGRKLTGAGDQQAEYQGWIQAADADSGFIVNAIRMIRAQFPDAEVVLRYLPAGIPLHWLDDKNGIGKYCSLRAHARPLMQIDAAAMARQRSKKNHRQNFNRLGRLGAVRFERVEVHEHFMRVFDEISLQYEFRQAALFRNMPFSHDPFKKPFHIELQKRGLLHTTVLKVGKRIAASHIGLLSKDHAVHLGMNTYDPALAVHSPGHLLLAMLGVHLATEKVPLLDLTAGGDQYKEHFATQHDVVSELRVYRDTTRRLIGESCAAMIRYGKKKASAAGYRPADVIALAEKIKDFGLQGICEKLNSARGRRVCTMRYSGIRPHASQGALSVCRDSLHDLMRFDAHGSFARYCVFLERAMKRMERSHHMFTCVQDGRLQMCCSVRFPPAQAVSQQQAEEVAPPQPPLVLSDLHVHREFTCQQAVQDFVEQVLFEISGTWRDRNICYRGPLAKDLRTLLQQIGFTDEGSQSSAALRVAGTNESRPGIKA